MQNFFFIAFPYIALILAVGVGLYRYYSHRFTYSSLSSQLLENRQLFWGSVSWHYGITFILLAHLLPWLFPRTAAAVLSNSTRLLVLELSGLALGFYCVFGIIVLIARRLPNDSRARAVTSPMDWILLLVLAFQVLSGVGVALFERWGASWYLSTAVPWLWSLARSGSNIFDVRAWASVGSGLAIGLAALGGTLGQGRAAAAALEGISRNPGASARIQTPMILGLALIESLVLFALVIAFMLRGLAAG